MARIPRTISLLPPPSAPAQGQEPPRTWLERLTLSTGPASAPARYSSGLALQEAVGHLLVTRTGEVTAWYLAGQQRWSFRTLADRSQAISAHATRLAELVGRRVHTRITHRPYPVTRWAQALHEAARDPLPGWPEYLEEEQHTVAGLPLDDKLVYYGVRLGRFSALARPGREMSERQLRTLQREAASVDRTMAAAGMAAMPVSATDLDWLMTRSLGLGLPAPQQGGVRASARWSREDLAEWTDGVQWTAEPLAPHLKVAAIREGQQVERFVTVLTLGRMDLAPVPEGQGPWLQRLDRLPFPYEVAVTCDVRPGAEVEKEVRSQLDRIRAQVRHHHEHGQEPPTELERQRELGLAVEDELRQGFSGDATRVKAWLRIAVSGRTADEVAARVEAVQQLYAPAVVVHRPMDQHGMAREFIPGEPLASDAHVRRMPVTTMAGALPAATAEVGDRIGPNLGYTSGISRRAVMWHPFLAQEQRDRSGLTPVLGTLGAGKSTLGGKVAYDSLRMGVPWIVLDPSGPLTKLAQIPELRGFSQVINLMDAEPGTLNPYRIVPDPKLEHYRPDDFWDRPDRMEAARRAYLADLEKADSTRTALTADVLRGMLPPAMDDQHTVRLLWRACREVQGKMKADGIPLSTRSPRDVVAVLREQGKDDKEAKDLADALEQAAAMPQGQLVFPATDGDDRGLAAHWRLTVMSLRGVVLPQPGTPRAEWTTDEGFSVSLLYLAGWYAQRAIYDRDMNERKGLWFDESHVLSAVGTGRELLRKTGRDSRKHNVRALYSTQNGQDILDAGLGDWVEEIFVGRTVGAEAQAAALQLLKVQPGHGYEQVLESLSPLDRRNSRDGDVYDREFIFSDGYGGIERITVTVRDRPALLEALNTRADSRRPPTGANPWIRDARDQALTQAGPR